MWKYILYWSITTTGAVTCPDKDVTGYGYTAAECSVRHVKTITDTYKKEFVHKANALRYIEVLKRSTKHVELDSVYVK